jgi:glycosyltransferase involved in cell wall biosynthesis
MKVSDPAPGSRGLKLLYLTAETWPTFRVDVAVLFGRLLPRFGVTSDLVAMRSPDPHVDNTWDGGVVRLSPPTKGRLSEHLRGFWHFTKELFKANWSEFDAVQVRDMPVPAVLAMLIARWHRRPFFYWMSFLVPEGHIELARERGLDAGIMRYVFPWVRGRLGRWLLYRWVLPKADHVFVQSDRMKAQMIEKGFSADRMTPVPMGVDIPNLRSGPIDPVVAKKLDGHRTLIYLGVLERARRLEVLFEMMSLLKPRYPDLLLLIVGDTVDEPQRARLRRLATMAGVSDMLVWTGWVPMPTAWGYVQRCEIGLSPFPRGELLDGTSPTKIIEYLALGLPVVCNDSPDQEKIIKACGAGRCVPYTAASFANAVDELLSMPPPTREEMSRAGRHYVATHRDYTVLAANLAKVYRSLIGTNGSPAEP